MTDFRIELEDQAALAELQRKGADLSELMSDIARALRNAAEDAFEDQRSPFGGAWDDLQPETKKRRAKSDHWPGSILQLSGGLAGSVGGRDWAEVGVAKEYAAIHQFGGRPGMAAGPAAIPARPYLSVSRDGELAPAVREEILDLAELWLRG